MLSILIGAVAWALTGGLDAGADRPETVAVFASSGFCSGVLIAPDAVLTLSTCFFDPSPAEVEVSPDPVVGVGLGERIGVVAITTHPDADSGTATALLTVLELARPITGVPIPALPDGPIDHLVGSEVVLAGYGSTDNLGNGAGTRRWGTSVVDSLDGDGLVTIGTANTCTSDGGGPVLAGDVLVAIHASGSSDCTGPSTAQRVDSYVDWLATWAPQGSDGDGDSGGEGGRDPDGDGGCGCATGGTSGWVGFPVLIALTRRRRRAW